MKNPYEEGAWDTQLPWRVSVDMTPHAICSPDVGHRKLKVFCLNHHVTPLCLLYLVHTGDSWASCETWSIAGFYQHHMACTHSGFPSCEVPIKRNEEKPTEVHTTSRNKAYSVEDTFMSDKFWSSKNTLDDVWLTWQETRIVRCSSLSYENAFFAYVSTKTNQGVLLESESV